MGVVLLEFTGENWLAIGGYVLFGKNQGYCMRIWEEED